MPAYAAAIPRSPRTLTELEQATLLKITGEHRAGFRDHVIFAVALGAGLREHEIPALDVGDVLHEDGRVRRRIALRTFKRSSTEPATQEVFIPDLLWYKLGKLVSCKHGQGREPRGGRCSSCPAAAGASRRARCATCSSVRQRCASFDRPFCFHSLKHSALTGPRATSGSCSGREAHPSDGAICGPCASRRADALRRFGR